MVFIIKDKWIPDQVSFALKTFSPKTELGRIIRDCLRYLPVDLAAELVDRVSSCVIIETSLFLSVIRLSGRIDNLGIVSRKLVTNNGVGFIVDAFQNIVELETMKYHGVGTGTNAEAQTDAALQTELTTQYVPDNTRPTGNTIEGATGNIYHTDVTITVDAGVAITEHGLFNQAAVGGGVLFDRSVFSVVNLGSGEGLIPRHETTFGAGG